MEPNDVQKAIRQLKTWNSRRRHLSIGLIVGGVVLVVLGGWGQHQAGLQIASAVEAFNDTPIIAVAVVSGITPSVTIARLNVFFGVGLACVGLATRMYPDSRATILLALLRKSGLDNQNNEDDSA